MSWQDLLHAVPRQLAPSSLRDWFAALEAETTAPLALAVRGGRVAASPGLAFLAGYQAALRALWPQAPRGLGALCATEGRQMRPAELQTRVADGRVSGRKGFVIAAEEVQWLLVAAREEAEGESPRLAMLQLPADAAGVRLEAGPSLGMIPDVPHARLQLEAAPAERLPGDGWSDYVKPFRSFEDLYIHAALLAWFWSLGEECDWPQGLRLRLLAQLAAACELARQNLREPGSHLLLAGLFAEFAALRPELEAALAAGPAQWNQLWLRDRGVFELAGVARAKRLQQALQALGLVNGEAAAEVSG